MARHRLKYLSVATALAWTMHGGTAYALSKEFDGLANKQPVMLTAEQIGYDEHTQTAVAVGNVEVVQGDTILLADVVTYNQATDVVRASGHVSLLEPTGDVIFAKEAILKQSLEKGVVEEFRGRLKDSSVFAAREARKISKNVTRLDHAVYSPCSICTPEPGAAPAKAPLWQVTSQSVVIDEDAQRVKYQNAFMDVYGVPVLYTPYFSHPTPDAPSQSGLLQPQYYHSTLLGNVVKEPVFVSLKPNMDMTLTPWYISGENSPMLQGEFRYLGPSETTMEVRGAIIDAYGRDAAGNLTEGTQLRDYIEAHGQTRLSEHWTSGIDAERASDNTFLAFYGIGWQDMLTSRLYAERIEDRNYAVVESLAFQGLQPQDIANQSPYILPQFTMHLESDPLQANSRLTLDSNALVLQRQVGDSDQRVSSTAGWRLPYITRDGQVIEASATLRGDAYNVINQTVDPATGATFTGQTGRVIPQLELDWRYPFINRLGENTSLMIAPIAEAAASPTLHPSSNIPNEDSQIAELSDINLFSPDRFTGLDQVESGLRGTYGMRGQLQFADDKYLEWLAGQAYQENENNPFPIATSSLAHFSDYVGRLAGKYKWLDAAYSFRLDRETLSPTSNEITMDLLLKPLVVNATYISLHNEPLFGDRKEIYGSTSIDLSRYWTWTLSGRKDLGSSETTSTATTSNGSALNLLEPEAGTVGLGTGLTFHNECMMIISNVSRSYINVADVRPATTFSVTIVLKNFGLPQSAPASSNTAPGAEKMTPAPGAAGSPYSDAPPKTYEQNLFDNIYTDTSLLN